MKSWRWAVVAAAFFALSAPSAGAQNWGNLARRAAEEAMKRATEPAPAPQPPASPPASQPTNPQPTASQSTTPQPTPRAQPAPAALAGAPVLARPGEVSPFPPIGTPPSDRYKLPSYDQDEDKRNDWSKKEFPHKGECRWMPTEWGRSGAGAPVTAAERAAVRKDLQRVQDFLKTAPVVNPPIGVCPWMVSADAYDEVDVGGALMSGFMIANWGSKTLERRTPGGRVVRGELEHLIFTFNTIPGVGDRGRDVTTAFKATDAAGDFFARPQPTHWFQGFPVYRNNVLIIARHDRPLWRPTSLARALAWQVSAFDAELKILQSSIDSARREHDQYLTPEYAAEKERIVQIRIERQYAQTNPAAQARIRANFDEEIRQSMATLRKRWDVGGDPNHPFTVATRRRTETQARLAALPAAQRGQPACAIPREQSWVTADISVWGADRACVHELVEPNPDYYDKSLPRGALQLLAVDRFSPYPPLGGLPGNRFVDEWANKWMMWGLDWQAFKRDVLSK